ncbi:MAG: MarR family transcriptional regulator [bacterium]
MSNFEEPILEFISTASLLGKLRMYISKCGLISPQHAKVLNLVTIKKSIKTTDISKLMMTTKSAATQLVDRLINNGYVRRFHSAKDRRIVNIELTEKGKTAQKGYLKCRSELFRFISSQLNCNKKEYPAEMLKKLNDGLKKYIIKTKYGTN